MERLRDSDYKVELTLRKTAWGKRSGWVLLSFGPISSASDSEYVTFVVFLAARFKS